MKIVKRFKEFTLKVNVYGVFENVKLYLMSKYSVYSAVFRNGIGYFRVSY